MKDFKTWFIERNGVYPMYHSAPIADGIILLMDEMAVWTNEMMVEAFKVARAEADQVDVATVVKALEGKK